MFGKRKHIIDVIEYEGPADVFVWKHDCEDFNTKSQLIVHESQEAVFFRDGQALDSFSAGRYTLDTQNIPGIRRLVGLPTGGATPFHCEVYYINKAISMGLPWGTETPIDMIDPMTGLVVRLKSNGDFSMRVEDGRKLLVKLVGTVPQFTHDEIKRYFMSVIASNVRHCISSTVIDQNIPVLEIEARLLYISQEIQKLLIPVFLEYGLALDRFSISAIKVDGLDRFKETIANMQLAEIEARKKAEIERLSISLDAERIQVKGAAQNAVKLGEGSVEAEINRQKGITEAARQAFETAKILAANEGPTGTMNSNPMLMGMGGVMQSPASSASEIVAIAMGQTPLAPGMPVAPSAMPDAMFPVSPAPPSESDDLAAFERRLRKLKMMRDLMTEEEFLEAVAELRRSILE